MLRSASGPLEGPTLSALGAVYVREAPSHLSAALSSLANQTRPANEVVLVVDGPIPLPLDSVIESFRSRLPLKVVRCARNMGLGGALNLGLSHCSGTLIARFDTDDINERRRFELQLQCFADNPDLDICGSAVAEFTDDAARPHSLRTVPLEHNSIVRWAWLRNPFNHPTVMFKRATAQLLGGYRELLFFEDFATWQIWLNAGAKAYNLPQVLVQMRTNTGFYERRGSLAYARYELRAATVLLHERQITPWRFCLFLLLRLPTRLAPVRLRSLLYSFLRRPAQ